ncbi:MAG: hypothetical protein EXR56_04020 [Chloroflexi bacterium]|nr:hypothetical protein [Chloroflexota bacterium]
MAFSHKNSRGTEYYLHVRSRIVASGKQVDLYFFAKKPGAGAVAELPDGYKVIESERTGLPILKKKSKFPWG